MRWGDLKPGDVLVSKRTDRVHLVLEVWRNGYAIELEFFSVTTQRRGGAIEPLDKEISPLHYEVLTSREAGQ